MSKGSKVKDKIKAEVIEAKIKEPELSAKQIAEISGTSERTASRTIKEQLAKVGEQSQRIAELIDRNNTLLDLTDMELIDRLQGKDKEKIRPGELVSIRESAFKQNQLVTGGATENLNNSLSDKTTSELVDMLSDKSGRDGIGTHSS